MIIPDSLLDVLLENEAAIFQALSPFSLNIDEQHYVRRRFDHLRTLRQQEEYTLQDLAMIAGKNP